MFQDGFVNRTGYCKLEIRFVSHLHVRKVLVGEDFENHARNGRQSGFAIVAVPHGTTVPLASVSGGNVLLEFGHDHIGQITGSVSGNSTVQFTVVEVGGIDSQCAYPFVCLREAGIAMESQCHFERNTQPLFGRVVNGTTTQVVDHLASGIQVVGIVVLSVRTAIDFCRHTAPLRIVTGTFQITGKSACLSVAGHVAHTSTESYGIGTYHPFLLALIAEYHHAIIVRSLVEFEMA